MEQHIPFGFQIATAIIAVIAFVLSSIDYFNRYSYPKIVFGLFNMPNPPKDGNIVRGVVEDSVGLFHNDWNNQGENDYFRQFGVLILTGALPVSVMSVECQNQFQETINELTFSPAPPLIIPPNSQKILYLVSQDFQSNFSGNDKVRAQIRLSGKRFLQKECYYSKYESITELKQAFEIAHKITMPHPAFGYAQKYDCVFVLPGTKSVPPSEVINEYEQAQKGKTI